MSKGSSGQQGGLCMRGHLAREDPGMPKGSSGHHVGLCMRGHQGRIPGCSRDLPDIMWACV